MLARAPRERSTLRAVLVDGDVKTAGDVRDVSSTGLFVEADLPLAIGARLAVVMGGLGGAHVAASVARVERDGAGLRFLGDEAVTPGAPELVLVDAEDLAAVPPILTSARGNRRSGARLTKKLVIYLFGASGPRRLHAIDLGRSGLYVATDRPPPERARVHLQIELPTRPPRTLDAVGEVVRVVDGRHDPGFGLHLLALPDDDRAAWEAFAPSAQPADVDDEDEALRARIDALELELVEAERTERSLFAELQALEAKRGEQPA